MSTQMVFVLSAPRSGSTLLERVLSAHSQLLGGPEPHLMTPLAHLGVWANVDKAPYDHVLAAEAQRLFVSALPEGEADYWAACRAYADALYGQRLTWSGRTHFVDKTPANALIAPFLAKVFPDAAFVVLTRHPAAILTSYIRTFFGGDYRAAHAYNPILERYVPALAAFLRRTDLRVASLRYEDFVAAPEEQIARVCASIGIPYEPTMLEYGAHVRSAEGLGDPSGVARHSRPLADRTDAWVDELRANDKLREHVCGVVTRLDPDDLRTVGYPSETVWSAMDSHGSVGRSPRGAWHYRLQRRAIVSGRRVMQRSPWLRAVVRRVRLTCDVLLRDAPIS